MLYPPLPPVVQSEHGFPLIVVFEPAERLGKKCLLGLGLLFPVPVIKSRGVSGKKSKHVAHTPGGGLALEITFCRIGHGRERTIELRLVFAAGLSVKRQVSHQQVRPRFALTTQR